MRFLIDVLHPAHVHFFHHFIRECREAGHRIMITARKTALITELLDFYRYPYRMIGSGRRQPGLLGHLLRRRALTEAALEFLPDALLGIAGLSLASVGKRLSIPTHLFSDTESGASGRLALARAAEVITPRSYTGRVRGRHVTYAGCHQLAYLHPARFTPDPQIRGALGLGDGERFTLVRFRSWGGDFFRRGVSPEGRRKLIEQLLGRGRVFISSDGPLPAALEPLRLSIPPALIHHAIAAADLLVGASPIMASEAAVLGTPAVLSPGGALGYIAEERRFGLVIEEDREEDAIRAALEILDRPDRPALRAEFAERRRRFLEENIDVTSWILDHLGVRAPVRRAGAPGSGEGVHAREEAVPLRDLEGEPVY